MASSGQLDPSLERAGSMLAGRSCLVALSGGPDSAALAWLANRFCDSARAVHVDHGQPASAALAVAAGRVATQVGMAFLTVKVDVPSGPSFEQQARTVRYEALEAELQTGELLITGHTADDNAETFLLNAARGAGMTGLGGIPIERGRVLRPMLDVSREVVRAFVVEKGLDAIDDPTNLDLTYTRNRIRHEVMPRLGSPLTIARAARLASLDDEVLDAQAEMVPIRVGKRRVTIPTAPLRTLPGPVANRVIRRGLRLVNPPYPGTSQMVDAVWEVVRRVTPRVELGQGVASYLSEGGVVLEAGILDPPSPVSLSTPVTSFGDWRLAVAERPDPPSAFPLGPGFAAFADPPELLVRVSVPGDRVPLRDGGHKEVADVFAEARIARERRRTWPVVVADDLVWWVPGVRRGWLGWGHPSSGRYLVSNILQEG